MTNQEKHNQCIREIKGTLIVTVLCCLWHVITAFVLNGSGTYFLGMPAWFSVSVLGTIVIAIVGVCVLLKFVFKDFEYDDEAELAAELAAESNAELTAESNAGVKSEMKSDSSADSIADSNADLSADSIADSSADSNIGLAGEQAESEVDCDD